MSAQGHRVVLKFDDGLNLKLICPESGCEPASVCGECHRHIDDEEREPCSGCPRSGDGCWVKGWFDNCTYDELLHGEITVDLDVEWDGDRIIATVNDPDTAVLTRALDLAARDLCRSSPNPEMFMRHARAALDAERAARALPRQGASLQGQTETPENSDQTNTEAPDAR